MSRRSQRAGGRYTLSGTRRGGGAYLFWLLLTLGLVYAAAHILGRTEGARALVLSALGQHAGLECGAAGMRPAWNLDLILEDVYALDPEAPERTRARARQIRLRWRPAWRRPGAAWINGVALHDAEVRLTLDEERRWRPVAFARWTGMLMGWAQDPGESAIPGWDFPGVTPYVDGPRAPWRGSHTTILWIDGRGNEKAQWTLSEWLLEPVRLSRRPGLLYVYVSTASAQRSAGPAGMSGPREALVLDTERWLLAPGPARPPDRPPLRPLLPAP